MPTNEAAVDPTQSGTNMNTSDFHSVADKVVGVLKSRLAEEDEEHAVSTRAQMDLISTYIACTKTHNAQYFAEKLAQHAPESTVTTKTQRAGIVAQRKRYLKSLGDEHNFLLSVAENTVKDFEEIENYNKYQRLPADDTLTQTATNHLEDWFLTMTDEAFEEASFSLRTDWENRLIEATAKRESGKETQSHKANSKGSRLSFVRRLLGGASGA